MNAPFDLAGNNFQIPEHFIGKTVHVSYALPTPVEQASVAGKSLRLDFPGMQVKLLRDLGGSILVEGEKGSELVVPKNRIWTISLPPSRLT